MFVMLRSVQPCIFVETCYNVEAVKNITITNTALEQCYLIYSKTQQLQKATILYLLKKVEY